MREGSEANQAPNQVSSKTASEKGSSLAPKETHTHTHRMATPRHPERTSHGSTTAHCTQQLLHSSGLQPAFLKSGAAQLFSPCVSREAFLTALQGPSFPFSLFLARFHFCVAPAHTTVSCIHSKARETHRSRRRDFLEGFFSFRDALKPREGEEESARVQNAAKVLDSKN